MCMAVSIIIMQSPLCCYHMLLDFVICYSHVTLVCQPPLQYLGESSMEISVCHQIDSSDYFEDSVENNTLFI